MTEYNNAIQRLSDHLKIHHVKCIEDTSNLFFGQNGMPLARYYSNDGIIIAEIIMDVQGKVTEDGNLMDLGMIIVAVMAL